jgi:iron complex transport system substrate-binding protein
MTSTALRPRLLAVTGIAAALALTGCSATPAEETGDAGSRTVETVFGEVTVPAEIESVIVLEGRRDMDLVLSLGLPLVGFPDEGEESGLELEPPLAALTADAVDAGATELFLADEINIEAIAEAAPTLIVGRYSDVEPILDELNAIAPTIAVGDQSTSTWQEDLALLGEATGTADLASELIAEYDARVEEISSTYAEQIAANTVAPVGYDEEGSQVRAGRLMSTALLDVGAQPSAAFADAIEAEDGVEYSLEQTVEAFSDADGIIALVNSADSWELWNDDALVQQLPAVAAGTVVRSDKMTHEGGPTTALASLDVIEQLYASF